MEAKLCKACTPNPPPPPPPPPLSPPPPPPPTFCHICTHVCTCTASAIGPPQQLWSAAGSWTLNHIQALRLMQDHAAGSWTLNHIQALTLKLDSISSKQYKTLSFIPMFVSESVAAFLQLHPSAAMGRCRGQQAGGAYLMSTLAWTAWPPCMLQWTP